MITLFKVGGFVRDHLLGVPSKDIDYAVEAPSFEAMQDFIVSSGGKIYLSKPEFQTIRAKLNGEDADFVLCRKDGSYSDGRRPDSVEVGTIDDDLARRDFTMNAIAMRQDGTIYDPFDGVKDLDRRLIRCVGNPFDRFSEDSLRVIRAVRFSITKGMSLDEDVSICLNDPEILSLLKNVSKERIREEMIKCFKHDTLMTLRMLEHFSGLRNAIFENSPLWLEPTMKE